MKFRISLLCSLPHILQRSLTPRLLGKGFESLRPPGNQAGLWWARLRAEGTGPAQKERPPQLPLPAHEVLNWGGRGGVFVNVF